MSRGAFMRLVVCALAFFAGIAPVSAKEHLVHVTWGAAGDYRTELSISKGKFKELCVDLRQGDRVRWSFRADADTAFNIHFHEGDRVTYPAKKDAVAADEGMLVVAVTQGYCWMWRAQAQPVKVEVALEKVGR